MTGFPVFRGASSGKRIITPKLLIGFVTVQFLAMTSIASATVITFDTVPIVSVTSYFESGVIFTELDDSTFSAVPDPNGTNGLLSDSSPRIEFKATLPSGVTQVSVDLGDFDADPDLLVLRAFGAGNNQLTSSQALILSGFVGMQTLTVNAGNIAYVTFGSEAPSLNGSSVYADNFTFTVAEPASLALLGTSLFAVGWLRRRRGKGLT